MTADHSGSSPAHERPGTEGEPYRARQITLPPTAQAAGLARRATREILTSWHVAHLEEAAVLLVSELVANVVRHTRTTSAIRLRLETARTWLRIEVQDTDPRWPQPRTPTGLDQSGFGFVLVDALADKWGVRQTLQGKAVWAEVDIRQCGEAESAGSPLPLMGTGTVPLLRGVAYRLLVTSYPPIPSRGKLRGWRLGSRADHAGVRGR